MTVCYRVFYLMLMALSLLFRLYFSDQIISLFVLCFTFNIGKTYSKIPILRPPFGLPKSGLIRKVVLILNIIS